MANIALPCQLIAVNQVWARRFLNLLHLGADDSYRIVRIAKLPHAFNVAEVAGKLEMFYLFGRFNA